MVVSVVRQPSQTVLDWNCDIVYDDASVSHHGACRAFESIRVSVSIEAQSDVPISFAEDKMRVTP
jgi:hypothetical protein